MNTSELKNRQLLIEFGASWCKPCREKNFEMKKLISKINANEISLIGISLDENKNAWLDYLKKDDLPWLQGILPKSIKKKIQDKYNAHAIPLSILFSEEGKVIIINPTMAELID